MSDQLPPPPIAAEVDLRDFQFMPMDVQRLRDSGFAARVRPEAFRAGLLLWCAAWHQVPAGSLPDDDIELARLAGYGYVVEAWQALRDEALYGWELCSDGRWYHQVVVEKAREAWLGKLENAHKRECDRLRKENKRRKEAGEEELPIPTFDQWDSARRAAIVPRPKAVRRNSNGNPQLSSGKKKDASSSKNNPPDIHSTNTVQNGEKQRSDGNSELSDGNSSDSTGHIYMSDGKETSSAGIPSENALKGQGHIRDRDRDRDIHTQNARARGEKGPDPDSPANPPPKPNGGGDFEFAGELTVELTEPEHKAGWNRCRDIYPAFTHRQDWITAEHNARALVTSGEATWDGLFDGTKRYRDYCDNDGVSEPRYVMTPGNFFGAPDKPWKQPWTLPPTKAETRLNKNLAAAAQAKRELLEEETDDER